MVRSFIRNFISNTNMAHFIGYLQGNRGGASRLGSKDSGIDASARGWNIGGSVWCFYDKETDEDIVRFSLDGGSNHGMSSQTLAEFTRKDGEIVPRYINKELLGQL